MHIVFLSIVSFVCITYLGLRLLQSEAKRDALKWENERLQRREEYLEKQCYRLHEELEEYKRDNKALHELIVRTTEQGRVLQDAFAALYARYQALVRRAS